MVNRRIRKVYPLYFVLPALVIFTVFFIIPNFSSFYLAFTDWNLFFFHDMRFVGFDNFAKLFASDTFTIALKNTVYFAFFTVIMKMGLGLAMALLVNRKSKFNNYLRSVLFMPVTVSTIVVAIVFVAIYNPDSGILNVGLRAAGLGGLAQAWLVNAKTAMTAIGAMEVWQWAGFNMVVFIAGIQSIPFEYFEAAKIDGASKWQTFRNVTVPLLIQSFTITFVFSLISGLKVFAQVYGTTNGGPADATQVMGTYLYKSFADGFLGFSSAVGLVFTVLILIFTVFFLLVLRKREVEY